MPKLSRTNANVGQRIACDTPPPKKTTSSELSRLHLHIIDRFRMSESGRLLPGSFPSRYPPVRFEVMARGSGHRNGATWWLAAVRVDRPFAMVPRGCSKNCAPRQSKNDADGTKGKDQNSHSHVRRWLARVPVINGHAEPEVSNSHREGERRKRAADQDHPLRDAPSGIKAAHSTSLLPCRNVRKWGESRTAAL